MTIRERFNKITWKGWVNIGVLCLMLYAIGKNFMKEREYTALLEATSKVKPKPQTDALQQAEEIARDVNRKGQETVIYETADPIIKKIVDMTKVDSISKIADVDRRKVAAITAIAGELTKENTDLKRVIQSLPNGNQDTVWRYMDPFLTIEGRYKGDTTFRASKIWADASVNKVDHSRKKYWLFGKTQNLSSVWFNSPYIKPMGLETMVIKQPEPFFDINVNAEGKFLHNANELLIGPKVRVKLGRVGISGGYYLNPGGKIGNSPWYGLDYTIY